MASSLHQLARDNRRQAIVDIAREVFLTEGYADATMSAIAARLGGSKTTLYAYFPSKESLFVAFLKQECELEAEIAHALDHPDDDLGAALKHLGCKLMNFVLSEKILRVHQLVIAEAQRFPELGRTFYTEGPRAGLERYAALFQNWMDEGRLRKADPMHAAEQFGELCKAGIYHRRLWSVAVPTAAEIEANVARAVALFLSYYATETTYG
jgi:AcrR family transcriptional regulator